jgi:periplasmic divalent cation tolerance protein
MLRLIYTTLPNAEIAEAIARTLLQERLAACCNILPNITSLYWWQGAIETSTEVVLLCKTPEHLAESLVTRLTAHHPYECPLILTLAPEAVNHAYADYAAAVTTRD